MLNRSASAWPHETQLLLAAVHIGLQDLLPETQAQHADTPPAPTAPDRHTDAAPHETAERGT
ncbi:hypothetical protein [Streptomyces lydicus]|uniref:hypothetical protein n=1 Tax=Streptomyces lydicus TaxID=47763 RepID=UPI0036E92764